MAPRNNSRALNSWITQRGQSSVTGAPLEGVPGASAISFGVSRRRACLGGSGGVSSVRAGVSQGGRAVVVS